MHYFLAALWFDKSLHITKTISNFYDFERKCKGPIYFGVIGERSSSFRQLTEIERDKLRAADANNRKDLMEILAP